MKSEEGQGSELSFDLPLFRSGNAEAEIPKEERINTDTAKELRLLLAEDNKVNVLVTEKYLKRGGVEIATVFNGQQAVEMPSKNSYDLILVDLHMSVMNGLEATNAIRKLPGDKYVNVPIITLTASSEEYYFNELRDIGMDDYLNKRFAPEELFKKILFNGKGKTGIVH